MSLIETWHRLFARRASLCAWCHKEQRRVDDEYCSDECAADAELSFVFQP